jgi:hypothetical protein
MRPALKASPAARAAFAARCVAHPELHTSKGVVVQAVTSQSVDLVDQDLSHPTVLALQSLLESGTITQQRA